MRYKNFLHLSKRCKNELLKKTPCQFYNSIFDIASIHFAGGFSSLEEHYKNDMRICEKFLKEVHQWKQPVNRAAQKERTRRIKDVNKSLDFYKQCLMLLDFYKKV